MHGPPPRIAIGNAPTAGNASLLSQALATLADVMLVTEAELDAPGPRILMATGDVERATGYTAAELIGQTPRIFQGPRTKRATIARIRAALEQGRDAREEILNYRRNGDEYWIELLITPIRDADGQTTHFVSMQRDISTRRRGRRALIKTSERVRDNVAENLHEKLAQDLAGISMLLSALQGGNKGGMTTGQPSSPTLQQAQQQLTEVIAQTRALAHVLAPIRLSAGGLASALRVLSTSMSDSHGVPIGVDAPLHLLTFLTPDELVDVYRIVEEALQNAVRHARATQIQLTLRGPEPDLSIEIADDGIGFDPDTTPDSVGFDSMRHLTRELAGSLQVTSRPGYGTRVRLLVPNTRTPA